MTGTAATEADEFFEIYKLEVVESDQCPGVAQGRG
jgi:preprotein translocase subunit SecA